MCVFVCVVSVSLDPRHWHMYLSVVVLPTHTVHLFGARSLSLSLSVAGCGRPPPESLAPMVSAVIPTPSAASSLTVSDAAQPPLVAHVVFERKSGLRRALAMATQPAEEAITLARDKAPARAVARGSRCCPCAAALTSPAIVVLAQGGLMRMTKHGATQCNCSCRWMRKCRASTMLLRTSKRRRWPPASPTLTAGSPSNPVCGPVCLALASILAPHRTAIGRARTYDSKLEDARQRKRKKKREVVNFYRFQKRQARRQEIADLREVCNADRQRVMRRRGQRKFRPF